MVFVGGATWPLIARSTSLRKAYTYCSGHDEGTVCQIRRMGCTQFKLHLCVLYFTVLLNVTMETNMETKKHFVHELFSLERWGGSCKYQGSLPLAMYIYHIEANQDSPHPHPPPFQHGIPRLHHSASVAISDSSYASKSAACFPQPSCIFVRLRRQVWLPL